MLSTALMQMGTSASPVTQHRTDGGGSGGGGESGGGGSGGLSIRYRGYGEGDGAAEAV